MTETEHNNKEPTFYDDTMLKRESNAERHKEREQNICGRFTPFTRKADAGEVIVIPTEIEVSSELDQYVRFEILDEFSLTYPKWIEKCYIERILRLTSELSVLWASLILVMEPSGFSIFF